MSGGALVRASEAAAQLGVSVRVVRRWIDSREVAGCLIGGRWYVLRAEVERLRDGKPRPRSDGPAGPR